MTTLNRHQKIAEGVPKTITDTDPMSSLGTKLKAADPEIQSYVIALEKENLKLQRQIGKHQAENVTLNNRIKALEEDLGKKNDQEGGKLYLTSLRLLIVFIKSLLIEIANGSRRAWISRCNRLG